jgi:hypothetical protein
MTNDDFKADLMVFAGYVEEHRAQGLVDVSRFRHAMGPSTQE